MTDVEKAEKVDIKGYSTLEECLNKNSDSSSESYTDVTYRLCQRWVYANGADSRTVAVIDRLGYNEGLGYWLQDIKEAETQKILEAVDRALDHYPPEQVDVTEEDGMMSVTLCFGSGSDGFESNIARTDECDIAYLREELDKRNIGQVGF